VEFFQPLPPPRPRPAHPRRPGFGGPWVGPPANVLAGVAPLRFVLARTDTAVVTVTEVHVYPNGFELELTVHTLDGADFDGRWFRLLHEPLDRTGAVRPEFLRFGLSFADGRKATNLDSTTQEWLTALGKGEPPREPLLRLHGAQGDGREYTFDYWAWPLPPPGSLSFVCEWPGVGVPLTRYDVDAEEILAASRQARLLWGEEGRFYRPGGGSYVVLSRSEPDASTEEET
jgi:hypothetical protein